MANYPTGLNGWVYMSKTEYNSITHDENTKYTVRDGNSVTEYLGDVMIVSEEGDSWVTMAVFEEQMDIVQDIIDNVNDRVVALENWKTNTVTPAINAINTKIAGIESWKEDVNSDISEMKQFIASFDISEFNQWKSSVNASLTRLESAIESIQSSLSYLQSNAVLSTDIRTIDEVSAMPSEPVQSTLYIIAGGDS